MTSYFDNAGTELRKLREAGRAMYDPELMAWEEKIIWDCTLAAEWPGCPEEIRDAIHKVIAEHSVFNTEPHCDNPNLRDGFEDEDTYELGQLSWDLHSCFHELARADVEGFSDQPSTPLRVLFAKGEERREKLLRAKFPAFDAYCTKLLDGMARDRAEYEAAQAARQAATASDERSEETKP